LKLKTLVAITLVVFACSFAFAERPAKSLSTGKGAGWGSASPAALPPSVAFYYTGTFDGSNANANGLFNANSTVYPVSAQVFVAYEAPTGGTTVADITFYEQVTGVTDLSGGTYTIETNVVAGVGGTVVKTGNCAAVTATNTGSTGFGFPIYAIDCELAKKDKATLKLKAGTSYWINVLPTWTNGHYGYLADVEDMPDFTQFGGADEYYNSYFVSPPASFNINWLNTSTNPSTNACGGIGCDEFQFALSH
jgi:hypothetical protein